MSEDDSRVVEGAYDRHVLGRVGAICVVAAVAAAGSGCGVLPIGVAQCRFPAGAPLAFEGRASLRQLGLGEGDPDADLVGMAYVTRDPVPYSGSLPVGARPPPDQRAYCVIYDDGADVLSAHGSVPMDWLPPAPDTVSPSGTSPQPSH